MHFNCRNLNGTARFFSNLMLAVHMGQTNSSNKFAANLNNMKAVSFFLLTLYTWEFSNSGYTIAPNFSFFCSHGNYMTLLLISSVYKIFCLCGSLIQSSQCC